MRKTKKIISGKLLEVISYPVSDTTGRPIKSGLRKIDKETQKAYNDRKMRKKLIRKVNVNFERGDYFLHLTYAPDHAPEDVERAKKDMANYIQRVKRARANKEKEIKRELAEIAALSESFGSAGTLPALEKRHCELTEALRKLGSPLKYIYVTEEKTYQKGDRKGEKSHHFHCLITGGLSSAEMEALWRKGRVNCRDYKPDEFGPESAANYMFKDLAGKRRICCSKNLDDPIEKEIKGGFSDRGIAKIDRDRKNDAQYWEKKYPGYSFMRCEPKYNGYNGHWYLSVVMYRGKSAPTWSDDSWTGDPWEDV